jgi:hypothetical protein
MKHMLPIASLALVAAAASAQPRMEALHGASATLHGVLIDAGCEDRSMWNMRRPAESVAGSTAPFAPAVAANKAEESHGITVDPQTLAAERKDVVPVMNPDLRARQSDPTCALKAGTRAYALLLDNGRLLDLDDGGDTYAALAVENSPAGRAMINSRGPGFKPLVTVTGTLQGDRMFVDELKLGK